MTGPRTITRTITVRVIQICGKLKCVIDLLEWRNWQTHGTQKPDPPGTQRQLFAGYIPFPATGASGNLVSRRIHYRTIT